MSRAQAAVHVLQQRTITWTGFSAPKLNHVQAYYNMVASNMAHTHLKYHNFKLL